MAEPTHTECIVDFVVRHGKQVYKVGLPLSSDIGTLKRELETQSKVPTSKQRLFLQKPVEKRFSKDAVDTTRLKELFAASLLATVAAHEARTQQHIQVEGLLIGNPEEAMAQIDSKATSEMARLVSTTIERDEMWFRCSYAKGYLRQTAYICRTCVNEKRALPDHCMCLACSEVCHHDHEVEEWGVRYYMRCDCCTCACWRVPNVAREVESVTNADGSTSTPPPGAREATALRTVDVESRVLRSGGETTASTVGTSQPRPPLPPPPQPSAENPSSGSAATRDQAHRGRKRSRSSSPLTPKRTSAAGGSPMSGIRIAPASGPSPFGLPQPPVNEQQAIQSPLDSFPQLPPTRVACHEKSDDDEKANAQGASTAPRGTGPVAEGVLPVGEVSQGHPGTSTQPAPPSTQAGGELVSSAAAQQEPFQRCQFVLDSATMRPMERSVLPLNKYNRYPRDPLHWCYCKDDHPTDSPDCGGVVCMLCTTCYWSTHLTRLNSDAYRRMPCYGDVVQGDTLAFWCGTCHTYVCTSCRYRCHKDHDVTDEFICPSREDGTDNDAPSGVNFSCGCRGLCAISESVPEADVDDTSTYAHVPNSVAIELMNNDVFTGFVCAHCLEEYPWILTEDPKKCWHGQLPEKRTSTRPVVPCAAPHEAAVGADVVPTHGAIFPVNLFYDDATCTCEPCREAFHHFAPRSTEDATEMAMQLHNSCDNCGQSVKQQPAFICQTCDVTSGASYFLCSSCNALRRRLLEQPRRSTEETPVSAAPPTNEQGGQAAAVSEAQPIYTHDLSHVFLEDTVENLSALCGMQFMNSLDEPSRDYVVNNWDEVQESFSITNTLTDTFGQVPIHFTKEEQDAFLEANAMSSSAHNGDGNADAAKTN